MENREIAGLSLLPLQDVVISQILPLLSPRDWCALRAVDSDHLQIVTAFIAANRRLELPYCKQLTEAGLSLLTYESTCLQTLTLSGCKLLTDDLLRPILQSSPLLTSLDLSECHHLTAAILQTVSVRCPRLARLVLSDCHWVSRTALVYHCDHHGRQPGQGIKSALPQLERVGYSNNNTVGVSNQPNNLYQLKEIDLTGCWELDDATVVQLALSFPRLASLRLGNIYSLTDQTLRGLATHSRQLERLDLRGCWRVTDAGVALLGEYCPSLHSLAVTDCRDVTESSLSKLRQRGVIIDRKLDPVLLRLARIRQENRQARVQI